MDDITPATRRMTYAELGEARGISPKSAERLAQRRRWPRQIGNDGMARVVVPIAEDRVGPRRQGLTLAPDIGDVVGAAIRDVVAPLSAQLEHERARADRAEEKAAALRAELVDLQIAEQAAANLAEYGTAQAVDLRKRLEAAEQRASNERDRADRAEQRAGEERANAKKLRAELIERRQRVDEAATAERIAHDEAAGLRAELDARRVWGLARRLRWALGRRR